MKEKESWIVLDITLADELAFKGALFLGVGLGLNIALRIVGINPSNYSSEIYVILVYSFLCYF